MRAVTRLLLLTGLIGLTASCTPFGEGAFGGGASSSSFSSIGSPVPVGSPDIRARDLLLGAFGDALAASMDAGSFRGLDPAALVTTDPSIRVAGDVPARVGVVSVNLASGGGLVMSTKSGSGRVFCVSAPDLGLANFAPPRGGTVDAHGATSTQDCTGRDWVSNP
jgi:hypothetical protein